MFILGEKGHVTEAVTKDTIWLFCQYNYSYTSDSCWNSWIGQKSQSSPSLPIMSLLADVRTVTRALFAEL